MTASNRMSEAKIKIIILVISVLISLALQAKAQGGLDAIGAMSPSDTHSQAVDAPKAVSSPNAVTGPLPLHDAINSPYDDIKPRLTSCGTRLYFSRNFHPGNVNAVNDPEDIWYCDLDKTTNKWSEPKHLNGVLNNAGPNYVNNVSVTGDTIILGNEYLKKGKMRAGLSYSTRVNGEWTTPVAIRIKGDYNMSQHSNSFVSLKNGIIIRSVERLESIGKRDLFVSFWDGEAATEPVSMGTVINTEAEESSPYLAPDLKTLYFASQGHDGFGGYDIYVTRRLDDTWTNWSKPENLGPLVNGEMDDEFFSISHSGNFAVFSKQVNIHNNDLFSISMEALAGLK